MKSIICLALLILAAACSQNKSFDPSKLTVEWELVKNNYDGKGNFLAALTLSANAQIPSTDWTIFFNLRYHTRDLKSTNGNVIIEQVNGELFTLKPSPSFKPTQSIRVEFTGGRKIANFQDVPSGFFYVGADDKPIVLERKVVKPTDLELPTADNYTDVADIADPVKVLPTPTSYRPGSGTFVLDDKTSISSDFPNEANYLSNEIEKLTGFKPKVGMSGNITIMRNSGAAESYSLSVRANSITIKAADAAGAFYGIQSLKQLFPVDSWKSKQETIAIEAMEVRDQPRFPVREFMLDVGRNFESKENILRLLEVMSLYKLNTFHFHFNDDEGWRLEIPDLPELTEVGSKRGYPYENGERLQPAYGSGPTEQNHHGTGFYSRTDFIEILKYATERHITVIPEIESPGHARAAIRSMEVRYNRLMREGKKDEAEQYLLHDLKDESKYFGAQLFSDNAMNVASPAVYNFIDKVVVELKKMYSEAGAPLTTIHMGGDEVAHGAWTKSPAMDEFMKNNPSIKGPKDVYADFFVKTTALLEKHGLKITGWEEMIIEDPHIEATGRKVIDNKKYKFDRLTFDAWWDIQGGQDMAYPIANEGYGVVLAPFDFFYFDLAQAPGFDEPGDAWIGYLDIKKTYSFNPFDIYHSSPFTFNYGPLDTSRFANKPKLTEEGRRNIRGLQGALWAENMTYDGYMEYQVLPRLLSLAERAWSPEPVWANEKGVQRTEHFNADWSSFVNRLKKRELPRMDYYNGGYKYRPL